MEQNVEINLCELLGIDVEGIAYRLAMEEEDTSDIQQTTSPVSEHDRNLEENAMRLQMLMDLTETKSERPQKRQRTAAVSYST